MNERRRDFYRCLTEKLLTYALGRGLDYYDVEAVDQIVERFSRKNVEATVAYRRRRIGAPSRNDGLRNVGSRIPATNHE